MSGPKSRAYLMPFIRLSRDYYTNGYEEVTREVEVTVTVDGVIQAVLLCLPEALRELAVGHLAATGVIDNLNRIAAIAIDEENFRVQIRTRPGTPVTPAAPHPESPYLTAVQTRKLAGVLTSVSPLFQRTGGVHTGGLADSAGKLLFIYEDTSRHNVMDKIFGRCILDGLPTTDKVLLFSGRCTAQIVRKLAVMGSPFIIARGAPTTMAIRLADENGISLVAFARPDRVSIYSHPERLKTF